MKQKRDGKEVQNDLPVAWQGTGAPKTKKVISWFSRLLIRHLCAHVFTKNKMNLNSCWIYDGCVNYISKNESFALQSYSAYMDTFKLCMIV